MKITSTLEISEIIGRAIVKESMSLTKRYTCFQNQMLIFSGKVKTCNTHLRVILIVLLKKNLLEIHAPFYFSELGTITIPHIEIKIIELIDPTLKGVTKCHPNSQVDTESLLVDSLTHSGYLIQKVHIAKKCCNDFSGVRILKVSIFDTFVKGFIWNETF